MYHILFYNTGFDTKYEKQLLKQWNIHGVQIHQIDTREYSLQEAIQKTKADGIEIIYENVTDEVISNSAQLKIIAIPSIGYNNIDVEAATKHQVYVTNVPGYCVEEVAIHAVGMAIDLARRITFFDRSVHKGVWNIYEGYPLRRMSGKTFGLVYFGQIPQKMVPIIQALGMNLFVYAPTKSVEYLQEFGCKKAETLEELLVNSDFISVHTPLIPETENMFGEPEFRIMKDTAFFINTSRGKVVDEEALYTALARGDILGAAVDVIQNEKDGKTKLSELDNTIITPHTGFLSEEALLECRYRSLKAMVDVIVRGKTPEHPVNREWNDS